MTTVPCLPLTVENFSPFGWLLGKPIRMDGTIPAFQSAKTDFWSEHIFDPGVNGKTEILWVSYRDRQREVDRLDVHHLSQQAIVPLNGAIIHLVCKSNPDGLPSVSSTTAFRVPSGAGICIRAGCWHTTRVEAQDVTCLMLTHKSKTVDLIAHLNGGSPLAESALAAIWVKLADY